jgi:hypothetical protein
LILEVDPKHFVDWLFRLPRKKLMRRRRANEVIAVGRRLTELAYARPDLNLDRLALDVWKLLVHLPDGRVATNEQCLRFFDDFGPDFLGTDLTDALAALKRSAEVRVSRTPNDLKRLEYRIESPVLFVPSAVYGPKTGKRPPADDISERIGAANDAMKAARCTRPVAYVADALRETKLLPAEYCSISHVTSRNKALGSRIPLTRQEVPIWLFSYWQSQHPEYISKTSADPEWPERFVFTKCDC